MVQASLARLLLWTPDRTVTGLLTHRVWRET